jgi:hypothetical protein
MPLYTVWAEITPSTYWSFVALPEQLSLLCSPRIHHIQASSFVVTNTTAFVIPDRVPGVILQLLDDSGVQTLLTIAFVNLTYLRNAKSIINLFYVSPLGNRPHFQQVGARVKPLSLQYRKRFYQLSLGIVVRSST